MELLAASLRSSARALLGAEALGEIHQAGHRMAAVLTDVALERQDQAALHGERHHIEGTWLAILMEEVGEVASDTLNPSLVYAPADQSHRTALYQEIIQVAAVAVAWAEQIRQDPPEPSWDQAGL